MFVTAQLEITTNVGMGQLELATAPRRLTAVLGSCVGIAMYGPSRKIGAMAHVVLPAAEGREASPGKFADTAVVALVSMLRAEGVRPADLVVRIAGGACMFGNGGPLRIGDANVEAVTRALRAGGIKLAGQHVGGNKGRRVTLDCQSGRMAVEIVGQEVVWL
jgi:chemotaxis protein CheD